MNTNVNFAKISTKKLSTMLADANLSDESRQAINEVLASRQQTEKIVDELSPEEQAIMDKAEEADQAEAKKSNKLSIEECETLATELKPNLGHMVEVVPAGSISWTPGQIVGITIDKRNNKVLYAIKLTESGKRILKAYNSEFLKISEEKSELKARAKSEQTEKIDSEELVAKGRELGKEIVGREVEFEPFKPIDGVATLTGHIIGITPEKRVGKLLIKIRAKHGEEELIGYKVEGNYKLLDGMDTELNSAYLKRLEAKSAPSMTPEERVATAQAKVEKAKSEFIKWENLLAQRTEELAKAEAEYQEYLKNATSEEIL